MRYSVATLVISQEQGFKPGLKVEIKFPVVWKQSGLELGGVGLVSKFKWVLAALPSFEFSAIQTSGALQ